MRWNWLRSPGSPGSTLSCRRLGPPSFPSERAGDGSWPHAAASWHRSYAVAERSQEIRGASPQSSSRS